MIARRRAYVVKRGGRVGRTLKTIDVDGTTKMEQFDSYGAALTARNKFLGAPPPSPRLVKTNSPSLREFVPGWLERVRLGLAKTTAMLYGHQMKPILLDSSLADIPMDELTGEQIMLYLAHEVAGGLAKSTMGTRKRILSSCLSDAQNLGKIKANPAAGRFKSLRLTPTIAERAANIRALTLPQLDRFLLAARMPWPRAGSTTPWALKFWFQATTGLRPGELLAARWDGLDTAARPAQYTVATQFTEGEIKLPKGEKVRVIDVHLAPVVAALLRWRQQQRVLALKAGHAAGEYMFPSPTGGPYTDDTLRAAFAAILKRAGLPEHFTPHSMRHTFISNALASDASPEYVARMSGHESLDLMTKVYGRWLPATNAKASARVANFMGTPASVEQLTSRRRRD